MKPEFGDATEFPAATRGWGLLKVAVLCREVLQLFMVDHVLQCCIRPQ